MFRNSGKLLSRAHILESVWGKTATLDTRTVDTHISRIRRKLDLNGTFNFDSHGISSKWAPGNSGIAAAQTLAPASAAGTEAGIKHGGTAAPGSTPAGQGNPQPHSFDGIASGRRRALPIKNTSPFAPKPGSPGRYRRPPANCWSLRPSRPSR